MALQYECTTELDAVNAMLEIIGELQVNDLLSGEVGPPMIAQGILHRFNRKIQAEGLNCNTELEYRLTPDVNQIIWLPTNLLDISEVYYHNDCYARAGKLYNSADRTFKFTDTVVADIVLFLEYEDLPQHAREYIMILAARRFLSNTVGDKELLTQTDDDYAQARREFQRKEIRNKGCNILNGPEISHTVGRRV